MNSKTIDPQLTQINLFYKKDFYDKASNFLSTINNYSTELQASIDYNLTKVQNDVITSQKDFFIKLDNQMKSMQPQFAADWIFKFNSTGASLESESGSAAWAWSDVTRFFESPLFFHVYFAPKSFFILPKVHFSYEDQQLIRGYFKKS